MVKNIRNLKFIVLGLAFAFLVNSLGVLPLAQAQDFVLPKPGTMVSISPAFAPPVLKGIKVHPDNPFRFEFILDRGDSRLGNEQLRQESTKLIKYFLASLTIPEKDLWVNLSPYEKDRIVPESFGRTEMGRDLLAEDYMLKQITASLIYPEGEIGKKFWQRIYAQAAKRFGTTNIPVNTFNKVWIVPEKAVICENAKAGTAYVVESRLKVMLEEDYLSLQKHEGIQSKQARIKGTNQLGSQVVREIVIPELAKEVNEDKNFSQLRQVYNSLILATWYKKKIKDSILELVYTDKNKIAGVNSNDPQEKQKIYERYLQAFKKGAYNYIKEEIDPLTQQTIPRKYFSGGETFIGVDSAMVISPNMPSLSGPEKAILSVNMTVADSAMLVDLGTIRQRGRGGRSLQQIVDILKAQGMTRDDWENRLVQYGNIIKWTDVKGQDDLSAIKLMMFSGETPRDKELISSLSREIGGQLDNGEGQTEEVVSESTAGEIVPNNNLADVIFGIQREGKNIFTMEQANKLVRKRRADERVAFLNKIVNIMDSQGRYLFSASQLMKIVLSYKLGNERSMLEQISWLLTEKDADEKPLFNGYHISQIILSGADAKDKKELIQYLVGLKDADEKPLFNGSHISQIILSGADAKDKKELIQYLVGLKDADEKPLFNGSHISQIIYSGADAKDKKELIQYLVGLKDADEKPLFNGYHISQIILSGADAKDKKELIQYLVGLKDADEKPLFNGSHISQIIYSGADAKDKKELIQYLVGLKDADEKPLFNGSHISQIIYSGADAKDKKELIQYLVGLKDADEKPLFNGSHISQIIYSGADAKDKKELIQYLVGLKDADEKPLFNGYHISQIIYSGADAKDKKELIQYLVGLKDADEKPLFNGYHISQIILSGADAKDKKELIQYLVGLKDADEKPLFNGSHISQIIYSGADAKDKKELIQYLVGLKDADEKPLFNGYHISQIIYSGADAKDKKELIQYLVGLKDADEKPLFNGSHISQIILSGADAKDKKELIQYLVGLKDADEKPLFNGYHISQIILSGADAKDKKELIQYLVGLKDADEKPLFNGYHISQIILSGADAKDKKELIQYLVGLKDADEKPLFNGSHISYVVRHYSRFERSKFESILTLSAKLKISPTVILYLSVLTSDAKNTIKKWLISNSSDLSGQETRLIYSLLSNTEFNMKEAISLIKSLFTQSEQADVLKSLKHKNELLDRIAERILDRDLKDADNEDIKNLLMSPNYKIRQRVIGKIQVYVYSNLGNIDRRDEEDITDAVYMYISSYDWARPNAGLNNLVRNSRIIIQHRKPYLYWKRLPENVRTILWKVKQLNRQGLSNGDVEKRLVDAGYSYFEIAQAIGFRQVSLDAPLNEKGEGSLYDVIASEATGVELMNTVRDDEVKIAHTVNVDVMGKVVAIQADTVGQALRIYWDRYGDRRQMSLIQDAVAEGRSDVSIDGEIVDAVEVLDKSLDGIHNISIRILPDEAKGGPDRAMLNSSDNALKGGIDLSSEANFKIRNNGQDIKFTIDQAMLEQLQNAPGFMPVIVSFHLLSNAKVEDFLNFKEGVGAGL